MSAVWGRYGAIGRKKLASTEEIAVKKKSSLHLTIFHPQLLCQG